MCNKIFYQLTIEDIQLVAEENINRRLTDVEIEMIIDDISKRVNWYGAINSAILHHEIQ